ncbi:hypothetical protein GMD68_13115 [Pseudoflavonifractor sp. BIOML-A13]|nr:hypothetical protein [Pseudoflavonifractor sp. BIOML-A13]
MPDTTDKIPHRKEVTSFAVSKHQMLAINGRFFTWRYWTKATNVIS